MTQFRQSKGGNAKLYADRFQMPYCQIDTSSTLLMGRKPIMAFVVIVLILTWLGGAITPSAAQTNTSSTATTCPPACQEIVPVIPFVNGTATVQSDPQPPVFGGDAGMYVSNEGSDTVSVVLGGLTVGNVQVGPSPLQGAYDPYGGLFYVPNLDGTVSVVNPQATQVISTPSLTTSTTKSSSTALSSSYLFLVMVSLVPITLFYIKGHHGPKG